MLYWFGYSSYAAARNYEWMLGIGGYAFQRITDVYPDATLWGSSDPSWADIMQGSAGTCYIEAAMASLAEFPDLVKNVFVTDEENDEGVYVFRFYIRGKPWLVSVDDYFLFGTTEDGDRIPLFARMGAEEQYWAMLLEKAYSKIQGTYEHANGGFVESGLRTLIGCPVVSYQTEDEDADTVFTTLKDANDLDYVLGCGTTGGTDTILNECGIAMGHAYSLISAFELETSGTVDYKMYMIRNPWGVSYYNISGWSEDDPTYWTSDYISQVPHGVDPLTSQTDDGIFFVTSDDFLDCFNDF
jgi:hypothetical protein